MAGAIDENKIKIRSTCQKRILSKKHIYLGCYERKKIVIDIGTMLSSEMSHHFGYLINGDVPGLNSLSQWSLELYNIQ